MSRNQREGRYYGWVKGQHIRWDYPHPVSSWLAFRLHSERKHTERMHDAKRRARAATEQNKDKP